jgi:hypothetical protein
LLGIDVEKIALELVKSDLEKRQKLNMMNKENIC